MLSRIPFNSRSTKSNEANSIQSCFHACDIRILLRDYYHIRIYDFFAQIHRASVFGRQLTSKHLYRFDFKNISCINHLTNFYYLIFVKVELQFQALVLVLLLADLS